MTLKKTDAVNGPGIRCSIWTAGCVNRCEGCWAVNTWNAKQGHSYTELKGQICNAVDNPNISGVSLLGGDPFYWAMEHEDPDLLDCLKTIKGLLRPDQTVWCWTGYTLERLKLNKYARECMEYIDVLVDQPFDITMKDLSLKFRGSSNQRVIELGSGKLLYGPHE